MADESKRFETICGVTIAVFAAVLAINDLFAGKYGDDEIKMINEKASAYMWYQAKGIKETVLEGQRDLLEALRSANAIESRHQAPIDAQIRSLASQVVRYDREKKEILLGSAAVGPNEWAQEVAGEKGKVVGATEYQAQAAHLGAINDKLDFASLFLQLCLVLGAVSLVLSSERARRLFYSLMVGFGVIGACTSLYGLLFI